MTLIHAQRQTGDQYATVLFREFLRSEKKDSTARSEKKRQYRKLVKLISHGEELT